MVEVKDLHYELASEYVDSIPRNHYRFKDVIKAFVAGMIKSEKIREIQSIEGKYKLDIYRKSNMNKENNNTEMEERIQIPILIKSIDFELEKHQKYRDWDITPPSAEEVMELEHWYLDSSNCDRIEAYWPKSKIGVYHGIEGGKTKVYTNDSMHYFIVPLEPKDFELLIRDQD